MKQKTYPADIHIGELMKNVLVREDGKNFRYSLPIPPAVYKQLGWLRYRLKEKGETKRLVGECLRMKIVKNTLVLEPVGKGIISIRSRSPGRPKKNLLR